MVDTPENYYAILGVPTDADSVVLKSAYRQLARRYHPDLAGPEGALEMKRINRAYAVLSDPEKRQQYDSAIRVLFVHIPSRGGEMVARTWNFLVSTSLVQRDRSRLDQSSIALSELFLL
jgi:curved DNA-binding protein CbpA